MKRGIALGIVMTIAVLLCAAGPVPAQQPIVIKLGNVQATGDIVQTGLKKIRRPGG